MGSTRITLFLALGASLLAGTPEAGLAGEAPKPLADASATVTVTAEAMPVEVVKTPNPVRILDKAAIEATGARTLGDLLESVFPGQILSNGGIGTTTSLLLGGSRNQDVVVTLDGIRLSDSAGVGGANLNALGLTGIDRVEVQMGPCSSRFGSDAMGGVIALSSSASAPEGFSGDLKAGLGTMGIHEGALDTAFGWNGGWVRASVQARQEDQAMPTDNSYRSTGAYLGLGQKLGEDTLFSFSYRDTYTGIPIPWTVSPNPPYAWAYDPARQDQDRNQQIIGILRSTFSPQWLGELTVGQALENRVEPNADGSVYTVYTSRRDQAVGHLGWTPTTGVGVNWGMDAYQEFSITPDYTSGTDNGQGHHIGVDMEGSWEPKQWLRVVGSVREQWDRQTFLANSNFLQVPPPSSTSKTTYKLGVNTLLGNGFRVYASGGTGFSMPTLYSVMYNAMNSGTALQNEVSSFLRAGAGWEQGPWSARLEASRTNFSNLIYFNLNSYVYANGRQVRTQGMEGTLTYKNAKWGAEGFWRNQEAREMDVPAAQQLSRDSVLRRPFDIFGAKGWRVLGDWRLEASWSWFGPRYESFGSYTGASKTHFDDLSVGASWAYSKALSFSLRGQHLLQPKITVAGWLNQTTAGQSDAYQIYGFPAQPPTLTAELRYRF